MSTGDGVFDVVVIGGGVGGLVAGCYLAKAGLRVSLIEAGDEPGGLCRQFSQDGLTWNTSLYSLRGCRSGGHFHQILRDLALEDEIAFIHKNKSYLIHLAGKSLPITTEIDEIFQAAEQLTPGGAGMLQPFLEDILNFNPVKDFAALSAKSFSQAAQEKGVSGQLLNGLAAPFMISLGLSPERVSAYFAYLKFQLILKEGVSYPRGGAKRLVQSFANSFVKNGGELLLGQKADTIIMESDGTLQTSTASGLTRRSKYLVINADASWAVRTLGSILPDKYSRKVKQLTSSLSATIVYLSVKKMPKDLGVDGYPHVVYVQNQDIDGVYQRIRKSADKAPTEVFGLTSPMSWEQPSEKNHSWPLTAFFPTAYPGKNLSVPYLIDAVEKAIPEFKGMDVSVVKALGPEDIFHFSGNQKGSFCGWEMGPERYGPERIQQRLSKKGIYLAGHWTDPGPSILNCALSGRKVAQSILGKGSGDKLIGVQNYPTYG